MDMQSFIRRVADQVRCDERRAEALTFAVFQELRERLTPKEAADVASQLPTQLKGLWMAFERPTRPVHRVHAAEFIGEVRRMAALDDDREAERAVIAVFSALQQLLQSPSGLEGEAWDVMSQLPKDLKKLWLAAAQEARA
jgi:uncharacterized protein (DUF2267 family)